MHESQLEDTLSRNQHIPGYPCQGVKVKSSHLGSVSQPVIYSASSSSIAREGRLVWISALCTSAISTSGREISSITNYTSPEVASHEIPCSLHLIYSLEACRTLHYCTCTSSLHPGYRKDGSHSNASKSGCSISQHHLREA